MKRMLVAFLICSLMTACFVYVNVTSSQATNAKTVWTGNVTINADGSINPTTAPIMQIGNLYNLTGDITGEISVYASNIVIDGNGFAVQGSKDTGRIGFHLSHVNNVVVTDTVVKDFYLVGGGLGNGFYLDSAFNNSIYGNTVIKNYKGIVLEASSNNNKIFCNNITLNGSDVGIGLADSDENLVFNNTLEANSYGVGLNGANNNIIYWNNIRGNTNGGIYAGYGVSNNKIYLNNLLDNLPNAAVDNDWTGSTWHNLWNNGSIGNYWSDYKTRYPAAKMDASGIWNTPYVINENNTDNFPLVQPINIINAIAIPIVAPSANSAATTIQVLTNNCSTINLMLNGNITASQISNVTLAVNQSANKTILSLIVAGQEGTTGFGNITLPKSAVAYGSTPTVYVDNQTVQGQGYAQDDDNFYVWFLTHFSVCEVSVVFAVSPLYNYDPFQVVATAVFAIAVALVLVIGLSIYLKRRKKPSCGV